jgi:putative flippase GtrA
LIVKNYIAYVILGGVNTLLSMLCYLLLLELGLTAFWAFTVSFSMGIASGYLLHSRYVFNATPHRRHAWTYPTACVARLALGQMMLNLALHMGMSPSMAGLSTNVLLAPVGFLLTRFSLKHPLVCYRLDRWLEPGRRNGHAGE